MTPMSVGMGGDHLEAPCSCVRPVQVTWDMETLPGAGPGVGILGTVTHHAGDSPSLLVALVIRLFSRRFRRRALRLLISST